MNSGKRRAELFPDDALRTVIGPTVTGAALRQFLEDPAEQLLVVTAPALLGGRALSPVDQTAQGTDNSDLQGEVQVAIWFLPESLISVADASEF